MDRLQRQNHNRFFGLATTIVIAAAMPNRIFAADATMPIMQVGDWCFESQDGRSTYYILPSWAKDGVCKKILSINPWSFGSKGWHCEPEQVRETKDCAPSGCSYTAMVVARCQADDPVGAGKRRIFEFDRYKGNLSVKEKRQLSIYGNELRNVARTKRQETQGAHLVRSEFPS